MPNKSFVLNVITPEKTVYSGQAVSLVAPGVEGYVGILANHAPYIAYLKDGELKITTNSGEQVTFTAQGNGFLEVLKNEVVVLLDAVA